MPETDIRTSHVDYLQRLGHAPTLWQVPLLRPAFAPSLVTVRGVGVHTKGEAAADPPPSDLPSTPARPRRPEVASGPATGFLISMAALSVPLVYELTGTSAGVELRFGVWPTARETIAQQHEVLCSSLGGTHPTVQLGKPVTSAPTHGWTHAGLALGIPSPPPPRADDPVFGIDRLLRTMEGGGRWSVRILAHPASRRLADDLQHNLIDTLRAARTTAKAYAMPSPLAEHYDRGLSEYLESVVSAQAGGAWRTAVYLLGDEQTYPRLAGAWTAAFHSERVRYQPVRVWHDTAVVSLASSWSLPEVPGEIGPGRLRHPYDGQSLLGSVDLAHYLRFPSQETRGFEIVEAPRFDVVPPAIQGESVAIGRVVERGSRRATAYRCSLRGLTKHALVAGVTGSGKTHTTKHLLTELWRRGVPFLVIEPAKTEYRELLRSPSLGSSLRVLTAGVEGVAPLRIDPFAIEPGVPVVQHIDLLKSVFVSSFGMWNPLPQVLERCIDAVYRDCGWDTVTGQNPRAAGLQGEGPWPGLFPTLRDLRNKVEEVVESLGYEERVTSSMRAALLTRLDALRVGAKGRMLASGGGLPAAELLRVPTIIELDALGDDDDKAFLMGLLLTRIYEHRRATTRSRVEQLRHLIVVEEAHRLLAAPKGNKDAEQADPRGKAVETFTHLLSEIRAYGQGLMIAEQIPSKLAPDVVKNTNLKITHRLVARDDRETIGATMNLTSRDARALGTLEPGHAAIFAEGSDRPLLVRVDEGELAATGSADAPVSDEQVAEHMQGFFASSQLRAILDPSPRCPHRRAEGHDCGRAATLVVDPQLQRTFDAFVLAAALETSQLEAAATAWTSWLRRHLSPAESDRELLGCAGRQALADAMIRAGRRYGWSFAVVREQIDTLTEVLAHLLGEAEHPEALARFRSGYVAACRRRSDPFLSCAAVCPDGACLFRFRSRELVQLGEVTRAMEDGLGDLAERVIPGGCRAEDARRATLCAGVQWVHADAESSSAERESTCRTLLESFQPGES